MITHLHVKSVDDSLNSLAVIDQTIFVENWLRRPSCFSEIAENQYQPSYWHPILVLNIWWWYLHNFLFKWSDNVSCGRLTHHKSRITGTRTKTIYPHSGGYNNHNFVSHGHSSHQIIIILLQLWNFRPCSNCQGYWGKHHAPVVVVSAAHPTGPGNHLAVST